MSEKIINTEIPGYILIASVKPFVKQNDDGTQWHANIIEGLIYGIGCINQFVPVTNIKGIIEEGSEYPCSIKVKGKNGKLSVDLLIIGD